MTRERHRTGESVRVSYATGRRAAVVLPVLVTLATACGPRAAAQDSIHAPGDLADPAEELPAQLAGTSWRLVEFRSPDDGIGIQRPEPAALYTMSLGADGTVAMQLDCNRANGTWTASVAGASFGFGPLRMTRAFCRPPSLDVQIARDTEFVSSYLLRDGVLYLNLMADGGTYVWEPLRE